MADFARSLFGTEETFQTTVSSAFAANYNDGYACFGWKENEATPHEKNGDKVILHYVRDRNILNKTELIRLQRQFEDCMAQIQIMQRQADSIPLATALSTSFLMSSQCCWGVFPSCCVTCLREPLVSRLSMRPPAL